MGRALIEFKNGDLQSFHEFLVKLKLKGLKSIARTVLCKRLNEKYAERVEQRIEIQKEYAKLDENGELIVDDQAVILFESEEQRLACVTAVDEHDQLTATIDCSEIINHLVVLFTALQELDEALSGFDGMLYFNLYEQLEGLKFEKEEPQNGT